MELQINLENIQNFIKKRKFLDILKISRFILKIIIILSQNKKNYTTKKNLINKLI